MLIKENSLAETVDSISEALFYGNHPANDQLKDAISWICHQQVVSGKEIGIFTPTESDYKETRLFTGEKLITKLATRYILGQEIARIIVLSDFSSEEVQEARERTNKWLMKSCISRFCAHGECRHSTIGFMRYLAAGGLEDSDHRLEMFVKILSQHRDGKGGWKGFSFYYTLLMLLEVDLPVAIDELRYAIPACEKKLKRTSNKDRYSRRRREILKRAVIKSKGTNVLDKYFVQNKEEQVRSL